jgi:hypothetical protein
MVDTNTGSHPPVRSLRARRVRCQPYGRQAGNHSSEVVPATRESSPVPSVRTQTSWSWSKAPAGSNDANAMDDPSGDHVGAQSMPGRVVRRETSPVSGSKRQIS